MSFQLKDWKRRHLLNFHSNHENIKIRLRYANSLSKHIQEDTLPNDLRIKFNSYIQVPSELDIGIAFITREREQELWAANLRNCLLLREKINEDLFIHFSDIQSELSNIPSISADISNQLPEILDTWSPTDLITFATSIQNEIELLIINLSKLPLIPYISPTLPPPKTHLQTAPTNNTNYLPKPPIYNTLPTTNPASKTIQIDQTLDLTSPTSSPSVKSTLPPKHHTSNINNSLKHLHISEDNLTSHEPSTSLTNPPPNTSSAIPISNKDDLLIQVLQQINTTLIQTNLTTASSRKIKNVSEHGIDSIKKIPRYASSLHNTIHSYPNEYTNHYQRNQFISPTLQPPSFSYPTNQLTLHPSEQIRFHSNTNHRGLPNTNLPLPSSHQQYRSSNPLLGFSNLTSSHPTTSNPFIHKHQNKRHYKSPNY